MFQKEKNFAAVRRQQHSYGCMLIFFLLQMHTFLHYHIIKFGLHVRVKIKAKPHKLLDS